MDHRAATGTTSDAARSKSNLSDDDKVSLKECQRSLAGSIASLLRRRDALQEQILAARSERSAAPVHSGQVDLQVKDQRSRSQSMIRTAREQILADGRKVQEFLGELNPAYKKLLDAESKEVDEGKLLADADRHARSQQQALAQLVFTVCRQQQERAHRQRMAVLNSALWKAEVQVHRKETSDQQRRWAEEQKGEPKSQNQQQTTTTSGDMRIVRHLASTILSHSPIHVDATEMDSFMTRVPESIQRSRHRSLLPPDSANSLSTLSFDGSSSFHSDKNQRSPSSTSSPSHYSPRSLDPRRVLL